MVAVFAFGLFQTANAASCTVSTPMKQGVKSADVTCLQTLLGVTPTTGYFGTKTKAAVMAFQTNHGLTADGVVGPLTRAALNGTTSSTTTTTTTTTTGTTTAQLCPNGMTLASNCMTAPTTTPTSGATCPNGNLLANNCAAVATTTTLPAGCTSTTGYSPTTGASCSTGTTGVTNGTNGALIASQSSAVSFGVTVNAGTTTNLDAVKLQATSGPVQVTSVDLHMNVRPWLYFSQLTLSSNGTTLATLPLSSSNATEVTVGSDYLINFAGLNYTVTPGTNPDLIVAGTSISGTNRLPQYVATVITNIKTINGSGWTDSINPAGNTAPISTGVNYQNNYGAGMNVVYLSANGSIAEIYANVSGNSPSTGQISISSSVGTTTSSAVLGVFSLESENTTATINGLTIGLNDSAAAGNALSTFSNVRLIGPGCTSGCGGLLANVMNGVNPTQNYTISFTNLTSPLALNTWTDYTIEADVAGGSSGTVYLTLNPPSGDIIGTDSNYDNLTFGTTATLQTSPLTLSSNAVALSNVTITPGTNILQNNYTKGENFSMSYELTNNSNNYIYVSAVPANAVTQVTTGTTGTGITPAVATLGTAFTSVSGTNGLDVAGSYYVLGPQAQRTFTITGAIYAPYDATNVPVSGAVTMTVGGTGYTTAINYSTVTGPLVEVPVVTSLYPINFTANF